MLPSFLKHAVNSLCGSVPRRTASTFRQGDFCMLRNVRTNKKFFIGPLEHDGRRDLKGGIIAHEQVIDKPVRSIIQLLDIEPGHRILEAGTGNGSLTLYLARAVAGGKVHTFDIREAHSRTAQKHVQRYARGRYASTVDFHLGPVAETLPTVIDQSEYFDGIVLDMPDPSEEIPRLISYLQNDRFLVCYLPNMTQVLDLAKQIKTLPLAMEDCLETEWKEWEVRSTQIRSKQKDEENRTAWVCRPKNYDVHGHTAFLVRLRKCDGVQDMGKDGEAAI
ncbi:hypothetical protein EC973_004710 [Apophysomyces ossiformis]|uniref:tRNA (adenine(58)-N(1))-methyltransferase catalytic subunit TRM61 n=1 Tax=Apophysomyces ossiformis TaxID=679940 RepID=A0A8H7EKE0_9FUNG|nr:hypothetical protein EC973_004710 [Apophysomyces ossiformis]